VIVAFGVGLILGVLIGPFVWVAVASCFDAWWDIGE